MMLVALLAAPIVWLHDEARARDLARASGRPLLIEFRAKWCGACELMDRHTWNDPAVQEEVAARFVPLEMDFDTREDRARRFHVRELPTILLVSSRTRRVSGFVGPGEMLKFLRPR